MDATLSAESLSQQHSPRQPLHPSLVVVWSADGGRLGELLHPSARACVLGREGASLVRQHPGRNERTGPVDDPHLSRQQLRVQRVGGSLQVENLGRTSLRINGAEVSQGTVSPGDQVALGSRMTLLCCPRPRTLLVDAPAHPFGQADQDGLVGESLAMWTLRQQLRQVGPRPQHVLVHGPSGCGKELVARALHSHSNRRTFVAASAPTQAQSLLEAELFGNLKDYPNPGMPAREGLIGSADRGTLFLDEIGEVSSAWQARMLRVLDSGEYTPLGISRARKVDLRLVAATNRSVTELKHDLAARLVQRIRLPGLQARAMDTPLLCQALLRRMRSQDPRLGRFFDDQGRARVSQSMISGLLSRDWSTHVREMELLLWQAADQDPTLDRLHLELAQPSGRTARPSSEQVEGALQTTGGNVTQAARMLGMSRSALNRLIQRYGLR